MKMKAASKDSGYLVVDMFAAKRMAQSSGNAECRMQNVEGDGAEVWDAAEQSALLARDRERAARSVEFIWPFLYGLAAATGFWSVIWAWW